MFEAFKASSIEMLKRKRLKKKKDSQAIKI